jgi:hypothetical protein
MSASIGTLGALAIGLADPVDKRLNYESEDFTRKDEVIDGNGIRGTRSSDIELNRDSLQRIDGPVSLIPTALELTYLLEWILGAAAVGNVYALADTIATRFMQVDRKIKVFKYAGVGVNKATFKASRGTALKLELDLVGQSSTPAAAGSFPAIALDVSTKPFIFSDLVITVGGTTVSTTDFELEIDNKIDKDRYFNSLNLTAVNALDREIRLKTSLPYGDFESVRAAMNAGANGLGVNATFTNGGTSILFALPAVAVPMHEPGTPGRSEIMLPVEGRAFRLGGAAGTKELTVTLDSTP